MRRAAADVAAFVGANADDLVFIDNTTAGVNAVMQSLRLSAGDDVVVSDQAYGGVVAPSGTGLRGPARPCECGVPYPKFDPAAAVARIGDAAHAADAAGDRRAHRVRDALIIPDRGDRPRLPRRGVPVLVDGAHVPGRLELNVSAIGADFYVANLHKWAMAPRSSAFMVASPAFQQDLHPPVVSWGYGTGYTSEFDWVGTRDVTPWLVRAGWHPLRGGVGSTAWRRYTHDLAWTGARMLAEQWGTTVEHTGVVRRVDGHGRHCGTMWHDEARRITLTRPPAVRAQHRSAGARPRESRLDSILRAGL